MVSSSVEHRATAACIKSLLSATKTDGVLCWLSEFSAGLCCVTCSSIVSELQLVNSKIIQEERQRGE